MSCSLSERISVLRTEKQKSSYAAIEEKYGVNRYYLWHMLKETGYNPPEWVRQRLDIKSRATVEIISGGEVPAGTQTVAAMYCKCGQPFITNHPRRQRCFLCSPYRGRKIT